LLTTALHLPLHTDSPIPHAFPPPAEEIARELAAARDRVSALEAGLGKATAERVDRNAELVEAKAQVRGGSSHGVGAVACLGEGSILAAMCHAFAISSHTLPIPPTPTHRSWRRTLRAWRP
jgi:hypothetical protein